MAQIPVSPGVTPQLSTFLTPARSDVQFRSNCSVRLGLILLRGNLVRAAVNRDGKATFFEAFVDDAVSRGIVIRNVFRARVALKIEVRRLGTRRAVQRAWRRRRESQERGAEARGPRGNGISVIRVRCCRDRLIIA